MAARSLRCFSGRSRGQLFFSVLPSSKTTNGRVNFVACFALQSPRFGLRLLSSSTADASAARTASQSNSTSESAGPRADDPGRAESEEERIGDEEYYYDANEPWAARASRRIWGGLKLSLGVGILAIVGYAGYTIVTALLPNGASANAIMRKAKNVLQADPEVINCTGSIWYISSISTHTILDSLPAMLVTPPSPLLLFLLP
jgi:hypothetical protein